LFQITLISWHLVMAIKEDAGALFSLDR